MYIFRFLSKFNKWELAKCNYQCGEYPRTLMYLEDVITDFPDQLATNLQFFGEVRSINIYFSDNKTDLLYFYDTLRYMLSWTNLMAF